MYKWAVLEVLRWVLDCLGLRDRLTLLDDYRLSSDLLGKVYVRRTMYKSFNSRDFENGQCSTKSNSVIVVSIPVWSRRCLIITYTKVCLVI